METSILESAGFTKGEIKVYLSLLELDETTTGDIIKKSKITGSKVYEILEKLIEKGLVSYIIKEKTKYFQASSPKRLLDYVDKKERNLNNQKNEIKKLIPQLESKTKLKTTTQSSQIFEGYEGIKTVFNLILESLKSNDEYYAFSLGEELKDKQVELFLQNYHQKRITKKINVKIIAQKNEKELFKELGKLKGIKIKYYKNPVPLGVFIFKDYVATFRFKDHPVCFLIKSEKISNSYKNFFRELWKESNR